MVQCAMNGSWFRRDHPDVPVTLEEIVADAVSCQQAGAGSVHLHPRRPGDGIETLAAEVHDAVVVALRRAAPGLEISCSTQEDIDLGGLPDRHAAVRAWRTPPDLVTLNLSEDSAVQLATTLLDCGIGIEAGLFTLADAETLLATPWAARVHRVLVEVIFEHDDAKAVQLAREIDSRVAPLGRPRVWHGDARANWAVVDAAAAAGIDVRVGLEDTIIGRSGGSAPSNPAQVTDLVARGA
jgi:uncharacterized protein (DUF849 family)